MCLGEISGKSTCRSVSVRVKAPRRIFEQFEKEVRLSVPSAASLIPAQASDRRDDSVALGIAESITHACSEGFKGGCRRFLARLSVFFAAARPLSLPPSVSLVEYGPRHQLALGEKGRRLGHGDFP